MSAGPDSSADLVAVACVVESSLLLATEWSRVLKEYVYPLLKRLNELHPAHQFRLAFVTYGVAETRPDPLLSKRFFAPLSQVTKELREEPSKLGIGQTNLGSNRGYSALEGLVAAIELFDILMTSINFAASHAQAPSPQKEGRSLISHLFHIAAFPPDNTQRPQWNHLQHLDTVNWDSIPAELKKRKINLSLIGLRKIPKFQELQSLVAGPGAQSPWFNVRAPHSLLLAGFPAPQKAGIKRSDAPISDPSPDTKRQKVIADAISRTSPASPALSSARTPQNQRPQHSVPPQTSQPPPMPSQNLSSTQAVQATASAPSAPAVASPAAPLPPPAPSLPLISPQVLDQVVNSAGLKFGQMMERLKALEKDISNSDSLISDAQNTGQAAVVVQLQKDRALKVQVKEQIKTLLRSHYQKMLLAKEAKNGAAGSVPPNGSVEVPPAQYPSNTPSSSSERPLGPAMEEHKPVISDAQILTQFWQSRGGTLSVPNGGAPQPGPSQPQSHPIDNPDVAAQMQKLIEKKGIRPPNFGPSQASGTTPHDTGGTSNAANSQPISLSAPTWQGTLSATFPKFGGQAANELQIHVLGIVAAPPSSDIRTDAWPKNLVLKACKEPLKDTQELISWLRRHQSRSHAMRFGPDSRAPDGSMNEQKFQALLKFMTDAHVYAYAGWRMPTGKFSYNIIIFPLPSQLPSLFAGAVFPDGLPDLPGSGNILDSQLAEEVKPQPLSGLGLPQAIMARMQTLDPAKQKQFLAHIIRQEHLRRQMQQAQPLTTSAQVSNPPGMPIPPNLYRPVANIPPGLHTNANIPTNAGAFNTGSGTVNYEMMQSFMQRSAEGSTSQGMSSG